jgi:predicted nuclease of predicted toxin-antitoxin system
VRFLVDECMSQRIVERLVASGHDVVWAAKVHPGWADDDLLGLSYSQQRVLLTEDWDFGDIAIRLKQPAFGIAIVASSQFAGDADEFADQLTERLTSLGDILIGKLTIIEMGRVRHRDLTS